MIKCKICRNPNVHICFKHNTSNHLVGYCYTHEYCHKYNVGINFMTSLPQEEMEIILVMNS